MTHKLTKVFAAATVFTGIAAASVVFGQESTSSSSLGSRSQDRGMMNMVGQMSPDHMQQVTRMIYNCNRIMEGVKDQRTGPNRGQSSTEDR